jgi:hypothetical protein
MTMTDELKRDIGLLCSGDIGATLLELRMAYTVAEVLQMALIIEG